VRRGHAGGMTITTGPTVELTRFRVDPERVDELLAARPGMVAAFRAERPGFLAAELVRLPGDEWLDIVHWSSPEDFAASRARGGDSEAVRAFFAPIAELLSAEEGLAAG
jgi:quinol monooxygenase YgiN